MCIVNETILILILLTIVMFSVNRVQSTINEGRLEFAESPEMKLDKDPFPANMNIVELKEKKVMVRPS
jgi:hypothetical protein